MDGWMVEVLSPRRARMDGWMDGWMVEVLSPRRARMDGWMVGRREPQGPFVDRAPD